jgi:hypothetical protein
MLRWARCGSHKQRIGARYAELVFLPRVQSVDHVVLLGASEVRNIGALFSCSGGPNLHKKRTRTRYAKVVFLHLM